MHAHKSLNNERQLLLKIAELEIGWCAWKQGESLSSIVESVFEQSLVKDSSANTAYVHLLSKDRLAMYMHLLLKQTRLITLKM